jgi:hypothetical protein
MTDVAPAPAVQVPAAEAQAAAPAAAGTHTVVKGDILLAGQGLYRDKARSRIIFGLTALTKPILKSSGLYALQGAIGHYTVATLLLIRNQLHH